MITRYGYGWLWVKWIFFFGTPIIRCSIHVDTKHRPLYMNMYYHVVI